jgi:Dyp-type peroxidase family
MATLELHDIQKIVLSGLTNRAHATYLLYEITDRDAARSWLRAQLPNVAAAHRVPTRLSGGKDHGKFQLMIAFTHAGLERLGLREEVLQTFVPEFRQGMASAHRARVLGDRPAEWEWGADGRLHLLCGVYADEDDVLAGWPTRSDGPDPEKGLRCITQVHAQRYKDPLYEPFGFRDGISQPYIEGSGKDPMRFPKRDRVQPGEFILGYPNELQLFPASPHLPKEPHWDVAKLPLSPDGAPDLGRNGSFLVVRHFRQDVKEFRKLDPHVAAQLVGRWPSGKPLVNYPPTVDPHSASNGARDSAHIPGEPEDAAHDRQDAKGDNDFTFYPHDAAGLRCPLGAHIRRANPRDALANPGEGISEEDAIKLANQHRILRRGRPYLGAGGEPEGLFFMCLNTNFDRQFEFIQQTWINNPKFSGLTDEVDPIVGSSRVSPYRDATAFTTQACPPVAASLSKYVTLRGGGYFFLPGLKALRYLASLPP